MSLRAARRQLGHAAAAVLLAAAGSACAAPPSRARVELSCESFGSGPQLDCTVRVHGADGTPLQRAQVTLGASMPSMPMAHSVAPVVAAASARPGEYRGLLQLEMHGVWTVQVDLAGPLRDRVVRSLRIDECAGQRRCPALPAAAAAASSRRP